MSRAGHIPIRSCVGCGARAPKAEMLRIVLEHDGRLTVDPRQRRDGRGGYLHRCPTCWSNFARRKGVVRSLKVAVGRTERAALTAQLGGQAIVEGW